MKHIKRVLDNGLTTIMIPMTNTKIISMGFFVKTGSRNETAENNGIAHFLEHMMFKGTKNRTAGEIFSELDNLGTEYNAVTTTQYTYYYTYGNSDDIKKILDIMLDIYINSEFQTSEINKEKKVIIEEMRMRSDSPSMKLFSIMHKKFFENTSLARDIIGTVDTVMNFKKKDFVDFRKVTYKPENTVFVIAGNFSPLPIFKLIKKYLNPIENSTDVPVTYFGEKEIILSNMKKQTEPYVHIKQNNLLQQVYVLLAFPLYDLYSHKYREIELLSQLLSAGFSSRLFKALREKKGITYTTNSFILSYTGCSIFLIQIIINPNELVKGLKILFKELVRTKTELTSKEEMKKIKNISKNDTLFAFDRTASVLTFYGVNYLMNRDFKFDIDNELQALKKVKATSIQKMAQEIFVYDKINLFMYGNIGETNYDFIKL